MRYLLTMLGVFVSTAALAASPQAKLTPDLADQIEQEVSGQKISCLVYMKQTYPFEALEGSPVRERIAAFKSIAEESQRPALDYLRGLPKEEAEVEQCYWVMNGFHLLATSRMIQELAKREDVGWISHDGKAQIDEPIYHSAPPSVTAVEWNILKVMADSCWAAGYTGQGIIIGQTDTGVDYTHPALAGKWTGYWHVSQGLPPSSTPYDDHGHGTHITGTICGGDGPGPFVNDIGVAPGARYVAAKVLNSGGSGSFSQLVEGLQFIADLKDSVDIKAVSNSWRNTNPRDTNWYPICRTLKSVGILPIFANGNEGPAPGTLGSPSSYTVVQSVGATTEADTMASFSSRGPAPSGPPWNNQADWYRPDWNYIKPDISAPGYNIRSSLPNNQYANWGGTSMATPHVAGAVAILCQKNQALSPQALYNALTNNADQPSGGGPYPNNNFGWGRLNVWKTLRSIPTSNLPYVTLQSRTLTDPPPGGNGNGQLDPGETVNLTITLLNIGADARNVKAILRTQDNFLAISDDSSSFGNIPRNGQANNTSDPYRFSAHALTPQGHLAELSLAVSAQGDSGSYTDTVRLSFQVGTPPSPYVIWEDDFEYGGGLDSLNAYWNILSPAGWMRSNSKSRSAPYSLKWYRDTSSANTDYIVQLRNPLDLRAYPDVRMTYWDKYYFQPVTWGQCFVDVSTDNGSSWTNIRWTSMSPNDSTGPWTEWPSSLVPSQNVLVRFKFHSYGRLTPGWWYIDDFKIYTTPDNEPPAFSNTTRWRDTVFTGPFPVDSRITDKNSVDSACLYYRINSGSWVHLVMGPQGNDFYRAVIPAQSLGARVDYYLWARDRWVSPNSGTLPVGAPSGGMFTFWLRPSGVEAGALAERSVYFLPLRPNPARGPVAIAFGLPREMPVRLFVYDLLGRRVRTLLERSLKPGDFRMEWDRRDELGKTVSSGIYFVRFEAGGCRRLEKTLLIK
jgi:bacillopeptidase F